MVLEMPSENRQSQGRGNMGGQLIPDLGCCGWKRFWSGHWCFPQWCRYGYRRGRPEWSWRCVPWKNLSKVQRLLVVQYLESGCGNFEIDSTVLDEIPQWDEATHIWANRHLSQRSDALSNRCLPASHLVPARSLLRWDLQAWRWITA